MRVNTIVILATGVSLSIGQGSATARDITPQEVVVDWTVTEPLYLPSSAFGQPRLTCKSDGTATVFGSRVVFSVHHSKASDFMLPQNATYSGTVSIFNRDNDLFGMLFGFQDGGNDRHRDFHTRVPREL